MAEPSEPRVGPEPQELVADPSARPEGLQGGRRDLARVTKAARGTEGRPNFGNDILGSVRRAMIA